MEWLMSKERGVTGHIRQTAKRYIEMKREYVIKDENIE